MRDPDLGNNSVHTYELSAFTSDPTSLLSTVGSSPFRLFPNGTIKTNTYFKSDIYGYFVMDVKVKDQEGKFDTAQVKVSIREKHGKTPRSTSYYKLSTSQQ